MAELTADGPILGVGLTDAGAIAVTQHGLVHSGIDRWDSPALPIPDVWPTLHRVEVLANGRWIVAVAGDVSSAHGILAWPLVDTRPPLRIEVADPDLGVHASRSVIASIAAGDSSILVHDLEHGTGQRFHVPASVPFPALAMAATWIACMSHTGAVVLLDVADGRVLDSRSSAIEGADVERMVACSDGSRFAAARTGSTQVEVWATNPLAPTTLATNHSGPVEHLAFSPDGHRLASASSAEVIVHLLDGPTHSQTVAGTGPLAFSRDSTALYLCAPDGTLHSQPLTSRGTK